MSAETTKSESISIFISYAQADKEFLERLEAGLSTLRRQNPVLLWVDRNIDAGNSWEHAIDKHLDAADIILSLVSSDFIASNYCYSIEMQRAFEMHTRGNARVMPIILRPTLWQGTPFGKLQALPTDAKPITSWRNREHAFLDIVQGIRKVVEEIQFRKTFAKTLLSPPTVWHVPYLRSSHFTGREELLVSIHEQLAQKQAVALTQSMTISGVGKTETALEYAYRYRDEYRYIFWAQASKLNTLTGDFNVIASQLHLAEKEQQNQLIISEAVKHWLEEHKEWLLILDNADDLSIIYDFLPIGDTGHILLTTRAQEMGNRANRIEIPPMSLYEGTCLLQKCAQIATSAEDLNETHVLIKNLEGSPLALNLAAAFIKETGSDISAYLSLYLRNLHVLKRRTPDHSETITTMYLLTLQKVEEENNVVAELLHVCAFLAPDVIAEEMIIKGASKFGEVLAPVMSDPALLDDALETLCRYALVRRNTVMKTFCVHRLFQTVLLDNMAFRKQQLCAERVVRAMNSLFIAPGDKEDAFYQQYLPHDYVCRELIASYGFVFSEAANLLYEVGKYLYKHSAYKEARPFYLEALHIYQMIVEQEKEQKDVIRVSVALAQLYLRTEQYAEAEVLLKTILSTVPTVVTVSQLELATIYSSLAQIYQKQSKDAEAEIFYQQTLTIQKQQLGANHPDVAQILNNLAILYQNQKKYAEAETAYLQALAIREQKLGPDHPDTAQSLNNLGIFYQDRGNYAKAEEVYKRALTIREYHLGAEDPRVAESLNNLAVLYDLQGNLEQAEELYKRALAIYERVLGSDHPYTAHNLRNLAGLYLNQGRYELAESCYERAVPILESDSLQQP